MDTKEKVAYNIAKYLKAKKKTQVSLANHVGLTKAAISSWIKGTTSPDLNKLIAICDFLDISINDLFGYYEENTLSTEDKVLLQKFRNSEFRNSVNKLLDIE